MARLINSVLLKPNVNLKPFNEFGQHFNDSVITSIVMSYRGFAFDHEKYQQLVNYIMSQIVLIEKAAWKMAGESFNLHNCKATRQVISQLNCYTSEFRC